MSSHSVHHVQWARWNLIGSWCKPVAEAEHPDWLWSVLKAARNSRNCSRSCQQVALESQEALTSRSKQLAAAMHAGRADPRLGHRPTLWRGAVARQAVWGDRMWHQRGARGHFLVYTGSVVRKQEVMHSPAPMPPTSDSSTNPRSSDM